MDRYETVANYIRSFWHSKYVCDVVCLIGTSWDGVNYCKTVEVAFPDENMIDVVFLNDWYEGEPFVRIFGIKCVDDIEFTSDEGILEG